jgi:two-component system, LytTR family, response regulator
VIRVAIVDHEPLARSLLVRLCESIEHVDVVAQADCGAAALDMIRSHRPDVIVLDTDLTDMTAFELLGLLGGEEAPASIIVASDRQHAISAFDAGAIDYLVKPVRIERFRESIRRARCRAEPVAAVAQSSIQPIWPAATETTPRRALLAGERERRLYLLDLQKIDYIESYGNYVRIWAGAASYISRDCIKELAVMLSPAGFVRVQRSKLVNLGAVAYIERPGHGTFVFTLTSGSRIESTPTYRSDILRALYSADCSRRQEAQA